ncbi:MAG: hypothetical protein K9N49_00915 [Candidatus Marinimicrobia bacterium]|nr:hypothetical protein [Candidatus Neomarinimicrobiota bacterium]
MHQRCWEHDYCAPCFYMITLVTQPRRECLGKLCTPPDAPPHIERSGLGQVVLEVWQRTSTIYPGVEACEAVVMPDHFHGLLRVKERLPRPMGHLVKAFKRVSTNEGRSHGLLGGSRGPARGSNGPARGSKGLLPQPNWAAAPAAGPSSLWQPGF